MLAPDVRVVAMDLLRPPPGAKLDHAILTTYSLDLETLLALPLAVLAHADQGVETLLEDPLLLLEALREAGERLTVFVDHDGISIPRAPRELYSLLEPCVHPVRAPNGGAFHPKVWAARFVDDAGSVTLRIAVLSRNLTYDRSWDIALTSEAVPAQKRASRLSKELSDLIEALPSMCLLKFPKNARKAVIELAEEIGRARFPTPEGFEGFIKFHALGLSPKRKLWTPTKDGAQLLAIAPFVRREPLDHLCSIARGKRILVARQDELDGLPSEALETWSEVMVLSDAAIDEHSDDGVMRLSGLHAKMLAIEDGWDVTWWVGSANLSTAAWRGRNIEVMAELTGKKGKAGGVSGQGIGRFMESGFRRLCTEYVPSEPRDEDPADSEAQQRLTQARSVLLEANLRISCRKEGETWVWSLRGKLTLPKGVKAEVWPVSISQEHAKALAPPQEWLLPLTKLTSFVSFRLSAPNADSELLTRKLPATGMPEGRINHVLRGIINNKERLLAFLRALLGGLDNLVIDGIGEGKSLPSRWQTSLGGETLLEDLVRAASRDPKRLEPIRRLLADLSKTEEGREIIPDSLLETWQAVEAALENRS